MINYYYCYYVFVTMYFLSLYINIVWLILQKIAMDITNCYLEDREDR